MNNKRLLWSLIAAGGVILMCVLLWSATAGSGDMGSGKVTPQVTGAPKLQSDLEKIDLGDIKLGKTVQAVFVLTNTGDRALQFTAKPYIEVLEGC